MHFHTLILTMALATTHLAHAYGGRPCGLKIAPCPPDSTCVPDSEDCTDLNRCHGTCEFKNTYPSCGGFRIRPLNCDEEVAECKDDPRQDGCGMACDMPGICIPRAAPRCGERETVEESSCPEGLYCYQYPYRGYEMEKECGGICL